VESCTFMYINPLKNQLTCWAVTVVKVCSGIEPEVAAGTPRNPKITEAFVPTPPGPGICDAVAGVVSPDQLSFTVICVWAAFKTTVPKPVALDPFTGFSPSPDKVAWNVHWAEAVPTPRATANIAISDFILILAESYGLVA